MTPRYKLRTLLLLLAILPPLLWIGWTKYEAWKAEQDRRAALLKQKPLAPQAKMPPTYITETGPIPHMVLPPGTQITTVPIPPTQAPMPAPTPFRLIPTAPLNRP